jgi:small subunit ribosomal protein S4
MLESRLDNTVFRMGFVNSRNQGRHFVRHNHFTVNGKKVNIPSYQVKQGDVIEVREKSRNIQAIAESLEAIVRRGVPQWLEINKENFKGEVKGIPAREDITLPIQEQLIVELYSK